VLIARPSALRRLDQLAPSQPSASRPERRPPPRPPAAAPRLLAEPTPHAAAWTAPRWLGRRSPLARRIITRAAHWAPRHLLPTPTRAALRSLLAKAPARRPRDAPGLPPLASWRIGCGRRGAPPLAQRLPPALLVGPAPRTLPAPRSAAAAQRPLAGPTPRAWSSASRSRPPLPACPAHHHARRAPGLPASPPDVDLRRLAAAARKGTSSPSARRTRDINPVIMED
jgi:hypothetical protein